MCLRSVEVAQILAPSAFLDQKLLVKEIAEACQSQQDGKTFLNAMTFGEFACEARQDLGDAGLPTIEYTDMLARVTGNMATHVAFRKSHSTLLGWYLKMGRSSLGIVKRYWP